MKSKNQKKVRMLTNTRLSPDDILYIKNAIEDAGVRKFCLPSRSAMKCVGFFGILARGNENSAPAVIQICAPAMSFCTITQAEPSALRSRCTSRASAENPESDLPYTITPARPMYVVVEPYIAPEPQNIDTDEMLSFISKDGAIAAKLPNFEERKGQKDMMAKITEALNSSCHAILEGETGIGKAWLPDPLYTLRN
jgi:hypothetical protein